MANKVKIDVEADTGPAEKGLGGLRSKIGGLAGPIAIAGAAVAGVGFAAFKMADDFDKAFKSIRVSTGATGEELAGLEDSFLDVFQKVPNGAQEVANAIGAMRSETGFAGDTLEALTEQALNAGRVLGEDTSGLIAVAGDTMSRLNLTGEESIAFLDKLFVASQQTNVPMTTLASTLNDYGPVLSNLGLGLDQQIALFSGFAASGIEVSRIMPGINQFMRKLAEEGVTDLAGALGQTIDKIAAATTKSEALNIATEAFGAEGAQRMVTAIQSGTLATDDLIAAMGGAEGAINETSEATLSLGDRFSRMKNRVMVALQPLLSEGFELLERAAVRVEEAFADMQPEVEEFTESLSRDLLPILQDLKTVFEAVFPPLLEIVKFTFKNILAVIESQLATVRGIFDFFKALFAGDWSGMWEAIKDIAGAQLTLLQNLAGNALDALKGVFGQKFEDIANTVIGIMQTMVNALIGLLNGLINNVINPFLERLDAIPFVAADERLENIGDVDFGTLNLFDIPVHGAGERVSQELADAIFGDDSPLQTAAGDAGLAAGGDWGGSFGGAAGGAAAKSAEDAWEEMLAAIDAKTRAGLLDIQDAMNVWGQTAGNDVSETIINALADLEGQAERMQKIFDEAVERGFVKMQDINELIQLGPQAEAMALDFIDAFQGKSSEIGAAIFEHTQEEAAKAAMEAAQDFADAFNQNVGGLGDAVSGAFRSLSGLGGMMTEELARRRLEEIALERRLLKIKENNNPVTMEEAEAIRERLAAMKDSIASEKLRNEAELLKIQLEEDALPTTLELNQAFRDQLQIWQDLRDVMGDIEAGTFDAMDAMTLLSLGFQDLAQQLFEILAGLPDAEAGSGFSAQGGSVTVVSDLTQVQVDTEGNLAALGVSVPA